ncbi:hypothetical protein [Segatella asaccharophila]
MGLFADLLEGLLDESHSHRHGLSRLRSIVTSMVHTDFLYGAYRFSLWCIGINSMVIAPGNEYASGIKRDGRAVAGTIMERVANGMAEGTVDNGKVVKRTFGGTFY